MATIASLAIKITANINSLTSGLAGVVKSVDSMIKAADSAKPSVKSLEDAAAGLKTTMDNYDDALGKLGTDWLGGFADEQTAALYKLDGAVDNLRANIKRMGEGVADDILNLKPTMQNVYKAQQSLENLERIQKQIIANGGDASILGDAIEKAKNNIGQLAGNSAMLQMQMESLKSVMWGINNVPFMILGNVLTEIITGMKTFGAAFNERFNGVPGMILKTVAVIASLAVVIGLAYSQMTLLNGATIAWTSLLKNSMVYQGFANFIPALTAIGTLILSNAAATAVWNAVMALNPVFLIGAAIAAAALAIAGLAAWMWKSAAAAEALKQRIDAVEKSTAHWLDLMSKTVDKYKSLNDAAKQYHEANQTGLQKYLAELNKIDEVLNKQNTAAKLEKSFQYKYDSMLGQYNAASKTEEKDAIAKQMEDVVKDWEAFRREVAAAPSLSAADAEAARNTALAGYRESLGIVRSDAELLAEQTRKLTEGLAAGAINQSEFNDLIRQAKEKYDPAVKAEIETLKLLAEEYEKELSAAEELARIEADARKQLADSFRNMIPKNPVQAFDDLSAQLASVKDLLSPAEFAAAKQKLFDDLANGLGIAEFVNPKQAETMQSVQAKVLEYYNKLDALGKATFDLTAAQQRVTESFEKQSGFYGDYQKMLEQMKSPAQKMKEYADALTADANKFGWDGAAIQKLIEQKTAELFPEEKKVQQSGKAANNSAAVRGTTAYYEAQNKANQPMLAESKKQTAIMNKIAENTKPKPSETPFEIQAV